MGTSETKATTGGGWACLALKEITGHPDDTTETLRQIAGHNAAWREGCPTS